MTMILNESAFREWLQIHKSLSKKASGDVISRFKRCLKLESIGGHETPEAYFDALLQNPYLDDIPASSRVSMNRAIELFYEFSNY